MNLQQQQDEDIGIGGFDDDNGPQFKPFGKKAKNDPAKNQPIIQSQPTKVEEKETGVPGKIQYSDEDVEEEPPLTETQNSDYNETEVVEESKEEEQTSVAESSSLQQPSSPQPLTVSQHMRLHSFQEQKQEIISQAETGSQQYFTSATRKVPVKSNIFMQSQSQSMMEDTTYQTQKIMSPIDFQKLKQQNFSTQRQSMFQQPSNQLNFKQTLQNVNLTFKSQQATSQSEKIKQMSTQVLDFAFLNEKLTQLQLTSSKISSFDSKLQKMANLFKLKSKQIQMIDEIQRENQQLRQKLQQYENQNSSQIAELQQQLQFATNQNKQQNQIYIQKLSLFQSQIQLIPELQSLKMIKKQVEQIQIYNLDLSPLQSKLENLERKILLVQKEVQKRKFGEQFAKETLQNQIFINQQIEKKRKEKIQNVLGKLHKIGASAEVLQLVQSLE